MDWRRKVSLPAAAAAARSLRVNVLLAESHMTTTSTQVLPCSCRTSEAHCSRTDRLAKMVTT